MVSGGLVYFKVVSAPHVQFLYYNSWTHDLSPLNFVHKKTFVPCSFIQINVLFIFTSLVTKKAAYQINIIIFVFWIGVLFRHHIRSYAHALAQKEICRGRILKAKMPADYDKEAYPEPPRQTPAPDKQTALPNPALILTKLFYYSVDLPVTTFRGNAG